jgi:hypothetical protein
MSLAGLEEFLDSRDIKYVTISHSVNLRYLGDWCEVRDHALKPEFSAARLSPPETGQDARQSYESVGRPWFVRSSVLESV